MAAAVLAGLLLAFSWLGEPVERLSFDSLLLLQPPKAPKEAVVVKMGESSYQALNQTYPVFSRALHAEFLKQLVRAGARLVVFDVFFSGSTTNDAALAAAMAKQRNVVIGFTSEEVAHPELAGRSLIEPAAELMNAPGVSTGLLALPLDRDLAIRRFARDRRGVPSLAAAAAEAYGRKPEESDEPRWVQYYGPEAIPVIAYEFALGKDPGFFQDKVVFIGGKPKIGFPGESADEFATARTRWTGELMPGVEVQATLFLNLIRGEWLTKAGLDTELGLILAGGMLIGGLLAALRPARGLLAMIGWAGGVYAMAAVACWAGQVWFNWALLAGIQAPVAWLVSGIAYTRRVERRNREPEPAPSVTRTILPADRQPTLQDDAPCDSRVAIHDFTLLKCIGRGGYGEVWLAQSVVGAFKAVKVVFRRKFSEDRPYLREFEGLKNFEPISRSHPGWVSILHVAKDDAAGHFYYVMDPADDLRAGPHIDPASYQPKTLENLLLERKTLRVAECLRLGAEVADALGALHAKELVHRDVKPSNIIYIEGRPRLADIGLVAQMGKSRSYVGTEGYIPPEGPGTPLADIYSLGRMLYQAATGERSDQPRNPEAADSELGRFLEVARKACAGFHGSRYQTAFALRDALRQLEAELEPVAGNAAKA